MVILWVALSFSLYVLVFFWFFISRKVPDWYHGHNIQTHALTDAQVLAQSSKIQTVIRQIEYDPDQLRLASECVGAGSTEMYFPLPIWSWGLAFTCCSVYPTSFESRDGEEGGKWDSSTYFMKRPIRNGTAVYVPTVDVPVFIRTTFVNLDPSLRIVLVSGLEDIAQPVDLFNPNRTSGNKWLFNLSTGKKDASPNPPMSLLDFISDRRLIRWYVQNYDLIGCRQDVDRSCSPIKVGEGGWSQALVDKVRPIPVGLDLHSSTGKPPLGPKLFSATCAQRHELHKARSLIPPFKTRPNSCICECDALDCLSIPSHLPALQQTDSQ